MIKSLLQEAYVVQAILCFTVLAALGLRRKFSIFPSLACLIGVDGASALLSILFLYHLPSLHLSRHAAYNVYFYSIWIFDGIQLILRICVVYTVFAEAMRPMVGLHQAGKIVFRWVAVVSALVAGALVAGPGVFTSLQVFNDVIARLQQGVSVLTLCLLVFVCFAIRPLGLTFRSHIFGVSLGLGVAASVELVQTAWAVTRGGSWLYSPVYLFGTLGFCVSLSIWGAYFVLPDPERRMILLPTTSPFFFWNRISEVLGDAPGQVAVAGFTPDMLAPAEIEMLTAATASEKNEANSIVASTHLHGSVPTGEPSFAAATAA